MTPHTIPNEIYSAKVAVQSTPGLVDTEVEKKLQRTPYNIINKIYTSKIVVKSTSGLADAEVLHLGVFSLAGLHPDGGTGLKKTFAL